MPKTTELTEKEPSKANNGPKRPKKSKLAKTKGKGRINIDIPLSCDNPLALPKGPGEEEQ